jgi:hypothetical protein
VADLNKVHRNMSKSQWAMILADSLLPYQQEQARKRQGTRTDLTSPEFSAEVHSHLLRAEDQTGKHAGISGDYAQAAHKVKQEAPQLIEVVRAGILNIPAAMEILKTEDQEMRDTLIDDVIAGTLKPHTREIKERKKEVEKELQAGEAGAPGARAGSSGV